MMQLEYYLIFPPFSKYPSLISSISSRKASFQGICSLLGETTQVVVPQQETVFLLRGHKLFVVKLKHKNTYYMLMGACQEGG